MLEEQCWCL